jgi:ABC-type transport system involved in multi-copper enzyme maturation permease subunit
MASHQAPHSTRARPAPRGGGFIGEPNPLLVRELRQSLRLPRLPWTIAAVVVVVGLSMLAIGSQATQGAHSSAELGSVLFQGFLAVMLVYVALIGPATAASAIASEREGKTLEPLLLTSLSAREIARGKFVAAYAALGIQVVAMLPLAAIPFLFGGVGAIELVVGVFYVAAFAAAAVGLGLAVASRAQSLRSALAVAVVLPACSLPLFFGTASLLGNDLAKRRWPFLSGGPFWWSAAYATVPFGFDYVLWLVIWPLVAIGLPIWFFYVVAAGNLGGPSEDHSTPVKRWYVFAAFALSFAIDFTCLRVEASTAPAVAAMGLVLTFVVALAMATMIAGEPILASRLVRARWERTKASALGRAVGPGLVRGVGLGLVVTLAMAAACFAGGTVGAAQGPLRKLVGWTAGDAASSGSSLALTVLATYVVMYSIFLFGLAAFLRTRKRPVAVQTARAWVIAVAILSSLIPWLLSAIANGLVEDRSKALLVAAPSPVFGLTAYVAQMSFQGDEATLVFAAFAASLAWGCLGLVLIGISWERARKTSALALKAESAEQEQLDEESDEDAAEEEEAGQEDAPPAPPPPPAR